MKEVLESVAGVPAGPESDGPVRVWIENSDGSIARGLAEGISEDGAVVSLVGPVAIAAGDQVKVRIAFNPTSPTRGAAARVLRVRPAGDGSWCELAWTHAGFEREQLVSLAPCRG